MTNKQLGLSAYLSTFESQKAFLKQFAGEGRLVFTSLHMPEELNEAYPEKAMKMLEWLDAHDFKIIGDISKRTLEVFNTTSILEVAKKLKLYMLRIDYGFTLEEMLEAAKSYPLAFNASTVRIEEALKLKEVSPCIVAIHNFYPREYTALSKVQFETMNKKLKDYGIEVMTFIPNSGQSRGPVYSGLPTVEHQRYQNTYISYLEMHQDDFIDGIILSDIGLQEADLIAIKKYEKEQIITLPTTFEVPYKHLEGKTYTIRIDSPDILLRLQESREFATPGEVIPSFNTLPRNRGVITCDNQHYGRYSGEIQILKTSLPQDPRVNVIGTVHEKYESIIDFIKNGFKIYFTR